MTSGKSIPRAQRKRRGIEVYLPPAAIEALDELAERDETTRSATVERLIRDATR